VEGSTGEAQPFWVDTAWDGEEEPTLIAFGSDDYFELLACSESMPEWLAVASEMVIVLEDGEVIRITTMEIEE
jgi:hypothetical protein